MPQGLCGLQSLKCFYSLVLYRRALPIPDVDGQKNPIPALQEGSSRKRRLNLESFVRKTVGEKIFKCWSKYHGPKSVSLERFMHIYFSLLPSAVPFSSPQMNAHSFSCFKISGLAFYRFAISGFMLFMTLRSFRLRGRVKVRSSVESEKRKL